MDSKVGLVIQLAGISLITMLTVFLTKSLESTALKYWKYAWLSLALALLSLYAAFSSEPNSRLFLAFYYLCEYAFVYLLIAGCRNYASGLKITKRSWLLLIPAISTAVFFAFSIGEFNDFFNFHSLIMGIGFGIAFFALKPSSRFPLNSGWLVMKFAMVLLAFDFFHYTIIFNLRHTSYPQLLGNYLIYSSIIDLVIELLLGFGMVIVLFEKVRQDVEETHRKLKAAHDKLEQLAHVDPLTAAFTRHAFQSFLQKQDKDNKTISGCVGVFDIDNLKPINDRFGHAVGDVAISSAARAIRSLVRADDLIFRWGGDEFFVVMLGIDGKQAVERMRGLNKHLENLEFFGIPQGVSIRVSSGFADFVDVNDLETSVKKADAEMYQAKRKNKSAVTADENPSFVPIRAILAETSALLH